ncbi:unnamed protein product, partial [Discosporangium mesarthrocarpum]
MGGVGPREATLGGGSLVAPGEGGRGSRPECPGGRACHGGWEAAALALVTACSEDRLFLCRSLIQPVLQGGVRGEGRQGLRSGSGGGGRTCPGLPRGELIELICLTLHVLDDRAGAAGALRLKGDLLVCARALENWDIRFDKLRQGMTPCPGGSPSAGLSGGGRADGSPNCRTAANR